MKIGKDGKQTFLAQIRMGADWQTVMSGTADSVSAWRKQCAPRYRRRNYATRVIPA